MLVRILPPPPFDPRYATQPSVARGEPFHRKNRRAIVLGVLSMFAGMLVFSGGLIDISGHGSGVPFIVVGALLQTGGFATVVTGATVHRRSQLRFTGGVAMTQGGAVLNAGVVF